MMKPGKSRLKNEIVLSILAATFTIVPAFSNEEIVPGYVAKNKIEQVSTGIEWNTDLKAAEEKAKSANKMILWINMIGKMEGAT